MSAADRYPADLAEAFDYLDDLRESGVTNMWGAGPHVEREMGYDRGTARRVVLAWMDTFDREASPADRAAAAVRKQASS